MTTHTPVELIRAYVEGYRGSCDAPGFEACVEAEINKRLSEQNALIEMLRDVLFFVKNKAGERMDYGSDSDAIQAIFIRVAEALKVMEGMQGWRKRPV